MREEQAQVRRMNPASSEVVPAFGGRDLRGVASCSLEHYGKWRQGQCPVGAAVVTANREMDGDKVFRWKGEILVWKDLLKKLCE